MKILNITPLIPYPLSEGGKISQFAIIDYLRKIHEITLVLVAYSESEIRNINKLKKIWPDVNIEIINFNKINTKKSTYPILTYLKNKIKNIINWDKDFMEVINSGFDNPGFINFTVPKNKYFVDELIKITLKRPYDIIQVDFIEFIDIVYVLPKDIKKVFVHHEIRYVKEESALINKKRGGFENYIIELIKRSEIDYLKQYDNIFVFSNADKIKLEIEKELLGKVYNSPFPVLDENFIAINDPEERIEKLVFVGGESHWPNKDALIWYINDIAPLINKNFDIKLHIIGNWSEETIKEFSDYKNIIFCGYIDNIISYCENSIMVVPVRVGSGIRTKILYAMAQGLPVISASIGCEGILVEDQKSILIADTATEFANGIEKLLLDKDFRYKIALNAQIIAKKYYSQKSASDLRDKLYKEILFKGKSA